MLKELMEKGYPDEYNCAEKIIKGANEAYHLGLEEDSTRLFAAFAVVLLLAIPAVRYAAP